MLYDDFQNENSHHNCKDSVFIQNDIIIFRQNDIKTRKDKLKTGEQETEGQKRQKKRMTKKSPSRNQRSLTEGK